MSVHIRLSRSSSNVKISLFASANKCKMISCSSHTRSVRIFHHLQTGTLWPEHLTNGHTSGHSTLLPRLRRLPIIATGLQRKINCHPPCSGQITVKFQKRKSYLVWYISPQVYRQGKSWVMSLHKITKLLAALKLVFLQPFLQQLLASLLQDRTAQLKGFVFVELTLVQQDTKVLQERWGTAGLCWDLLEPLDGLRGTQNTLYRKKVANEFQCHVICQPLHFIQFEVWGAVHKCSIGTKNAILASPNVKVNLFAVYHCHNCAN